MNLHETLLDSQALIHFASAGAGAEFSRRLSETPGSSQYLIGTHLLQARSSLERFIGFQPEDSFCSSKVATDIAITAYLQAIRTAVSENKSTQNALAVAVTAAIATSRLPRGEQRAFISIINHRGVFNKKINFEKETGIEARQQHDQIIANELQAFLISILKGDAQANGEQLALAQIQEHPTFISDGSRLGPQTQAKLYFPANFNPIHKGHRHAYLEAERITGLRTTFMLEAVPPNKEPIPVAEILRRIATLQEREPTNHHRPLLVTQGQPNYLDKARLHPDSHFIAGADAMTRILQDGWGYRVEDMLEEFNTLNTRFLVLGRNEGETFVTIDDIGIPEKHRHLFSHLEGEHRISSTELRNKQNN